MPSLNSLWEVKFNQIIKDVLLGSRKADDFWKKEEEVGVAVEEAEAEVGEAEAEV